MNASLKTLGTAMLSAFCVLALVALVVPRLVSHSGGGVAIEKSDISSIESALKLFRLDCGRYPTSLEGLNALRIAPTGLAKKWQGPYMDHEIPHDRWGNAYVYRRNGRDSYIVESYGPTGKPGGGDEIIGESD